MSTADIDTRADQVAHLLLDIGKEEAQASSSSSSSTTVISKKLLPIEKKKRNLSAQYNESDTDADTEQGIKKPRTSFSRTITVETTKSILNNDKKTSSSSHVDPGRQKGGNVVSEKVPARTHLLYHGKKFDQNLVEYVAHFIHFLHISTHLLPFYFDTHLLWNHLRSSVLTTLLCFLSMYIVTSTHILIAKA